MSQVRRALLLPFLPVFILSACQSNQNYLEKLQSDLIQIAGQVGPSVVSIASIEQLTGKKKMGGGVVIQPNTILTTESVIGDASQVTVMLQNGERFDSSQIEMVCADYETGICLLKLKRKDLQPVSFSKEEVVNGTIGIVVGNSPFSQGLDVTYSTLSPSWIGGDDPYDSPLLALKMPLGENCGGMPVFNYKGELLGIVEGVIQGEERISLVLPVSTCEKVSLAMSEHDGQIKRGWIGVFVGRPCPLGTVGEGVDKEHLKPTLIAQILEDGLAKKAGLKAGDLILTCHGKEIRNSRDLRQVISMLPPGSKIEVVVDRKGEKLAYQVEVGEAPLHQSLRRCASRSI